MIGPLNQIAPRLKKLLLMLSSSHDGEVVAAARKIDSTLRDSGRDWHDLVAGLLTPARAANHGSRDRNGSDSCAGDWRMMRDYCARHGDHLRLREWDFINDLEHWRGDLTPKQLTWLNSIYARVRCATA
jgi:hypothetical protein